MQRMRLLVVVVLLAVVFAVPAMAIGPELPRLIFSSDEPGNGKIVYNYEIMNKDASPMTGFKIYAPLGSEYITGYVMDTAGQRDLSWTCTVSAQGDGSYSEIWWTRSQGLSYLSTAILKLEAPSTTTMNPWYIPPSMTGSETNWRHAYNLSTDYWAGNQPWPVPQGPGSAVPEPGSLISLASLGVLLVGAAKRRK